MKKHSVLLLALLALLVLPFGATFAQDPTAPPPTPAVVEAGTGELQLNFWHGITGGEGPVLDAMVQQFVEENPDISIRSEGNEWGQFYQKLQAAFVAGNPPDVFIMHANEIPHYASLGILRPSDDMFDDNGGALPAADYANPAFDYTVYEGQRYGVVLDNHGFGTWANLDAFERAGVEAPETLPTGDDFVELARQLTIDANGNHPGDEGFDADNVEQWGVLIDWNFVTFQGLLKQFGGSIISEDGTTVTVNSPEGIAALQWMVDLVHTHQVAPDPATLNSPNAMVAGVGAMMDGGTWFLYRMENETDGMNWAAYPMFQGGPNPGTWVSAHVIFLSPMLEGDRLAAAQRFVQWMSEHDADWATQTGHVPARISSQEALDPEENPSIVVFGQGFQDAGVLAPQLPNVTEVNAALDQEVNAAVNGQKTPEQALNDAAARMQQILDRGGM